MSEEASPESAKVPIPFFSVIRLRHSAGKYLASVACNYAHDGGSGQQVVGCVDAPDHSTLWLVRSEHGTDYEVRSENLPDKAIIRLEHIQTHKNLHSHGNRSPVTGQQEVTCFGEGGLGDFNDDWIISTRDQSGYLTTGKAVRIQHLQTSHWLHSHSGNNFEAEGTKLQEVTGNKESDTNNDWEITEVLPSPETFRMHPFLTLTLPTRTKSFKTRATFSEWLTQERNEYTWLTTQTNSNSHSAALGSVSAKFHDINQRVQSLKPVGNPNDWQRLKDEFKKLCEATYSAPGLLTTDSPQFKFVKSLKDRDIAAASHALAFFLHLPPESNKGMSAVRGMFEAMCFERGISERAVSEAEAIGNIKSNLSEQFDELFEKSRQLQQSVTTTLQQAQNQSNKNDVEFRQAITDGEAQLSGITAAYDNHMSIKASVTYWKRKGWTHLGYSLGFGFAAIVAGYFSLHYLLQEANELLTSSKPTNSPSHIAAAAPDSAKHATIPEPNPATEVQTTTAPPEWWKLGTLLMIGTFSIWGVRILVQLFYSNVHLMNDAYERTTMIQTYLAMLRGKETPAENHQELIVQTLFRPASIGMIKDDGAPSTWLEFVANKAAPKS